MFERGLFLDQAYEAEVRKRGSEVQPSVQKLFEELHSSYPEAAAGRWLKSLYHTVHLCTVAGVSLSLRNLLHCSWMNQFKGTGLPIYTTEHVFLVENIALCNIAKVQFRGFIGRVRFMRLQQSYSTDHESCSVYITAKNLGLFQPSLVSTLYSNLRPYQFNFILLRLEDLQSRVGR